MFNSYKIIIFRILQAISGLVALLLVAEFLNPIEQGYYYTLGTVISLIWIFDLGMSQIAINYLSKFFVKLSWKHNDLVGDSNNYFGALKRVFKYYLIASIFFIFVSPLFIIFVRVDEYFSFLHLFILIICLTLLVALNFIFYPLLLFLESSKKIIKAYDLRIISNLLAIIFYLLFFLNDFNIWAIFSPQISLLLINIFIIFNYKNLLKQFIKIKIADDKFFDILIFKSFPVYLSGFIISIIFIPIIHNIYSPELSGKFGMTVIIFNLFALTGLSVYHFNIPNMIRIFQSGNILKVNKVFLKCFFSFLFFYLLLFCLFVLIIYIQDNYSALNYVKINDRVLDMNNLIILGIVILIFNISLFYNYYFRLLLIELFSINYCLYILILIAGLFFLQLNISELLLYILICTSILILSNTYKFIKNKKKYF